MCHHHDPYNHLPPASAAADLITKQQKDTLMQQLDTLHDQMKVTTDPDALSALSIAYNTALQSYQITYTRRDYLDEEDFRRIC